MASASVSYTWPEGGTLNAYLESDLETVEELKTQAAALWSDAWASMEPQAEQ